MRLFGIIGYPLSHSFSPGYFKDKFEKEAIVDCRYDRHELTSIDLFPDLINNIKGLVGLNVTIPYKESVMVYLDEMDDISAEAGAVNTILISNNNGKPHLKGFNTDVHGFIGSIESHVPDNAKALVLGTGGASRAVEFSLRKMNIDMRFVSRVPESSDILGYHNLTEDIINDHQIIINTSPVGMHPNVDEAPQIPYEGITSNHVLFDLVYNPLETLFLKKGKERGATVINGLKMLHLQAEKAWEIWNS
ncbi:MAG: shikimate dehydrogenase [Bacteroidetes bacterium]|nr:shikimate dehydrogenase [Bacteroidota bacterium]